MCRTIGCDNAPRTNESTYCLPCSSHEWRWPHITRIQFAEMRGPGQCGACSEMAHRRQVIRTPCAIHGASQKGCIECTEGSVCLLCSAAYHNMINSAEPAHGWGRNRGILNFFHIRYAADFDDEKAEWARTEKLVSEREDAALADSEPIGPSPHGSRAPYRRGCRCGECREWKAKEDRAYQIRKRVSSSATSSE